MRAIAPISYRIIGADITVGPDRDDNIVIEDEDDGSQVIVTADTVPALIEALQAVLAEMKS